MEKKKIRDNHQAKNERTMDSEAAERRVSGNLIGNPEQISCLSLLDLEGKIRFVENYDYKSMRK